MTSPRVPSTLLCIAALATWISSCGGDQGPSGGAGVTTPFIAISVGGGFTCGLSPSHQAYCWGSNYSGNLGNGTLSDTVLPVPVSGGLKFSQIAAGYAHACGLTFDQRAYCWGYNFGGQLGDGTSTDRREPTQVASTVRFTRISLGVAHTCAIATDVRLYCWGSNGYGELGTGTINDDSIPVPIGGSLRFVAVSAGSWHTCGVTTAGEAWCWGYNDLGQLGDGTITEQHTPVQVAGGHKFASVTAGGIEHSCGVTAGDTLYCWGANHLSQFGDGTQGNGSISPTLAAGGMKFTQVAAGNYFTCGISLTRLAYCWGFGDGIGTLGNGTATSIERSPVPVAGNHLFSSLSTGPASACGTTPSLEAWCWGQNAYGQLGNGTTTDQLAPSLVGP
jgi:alpha-tubulin suppressor-like RCC1 family protein